MVKIKIPTRLIATTILMALILVLIVVIIISLINEKGRIQSALDLSQQNREQILKTEGVTESLLLVEVRFKEYCTTFEKPVFEDYKTQVKTLAENIKLLQQPVSGESKEESSRITQIFEEKTKEADIYVKLRLITDSLMSSVASLDETETEIDKYFGSRSEGRVDTLSVTKTSEKYKKGLLGKIKSAIVGEKIQESVNTKLLVQSPSEKLSHESYQKSGRNLKNIKELVLRSNDLKESELNLIKINNSLISEIRKLINEIKSSIKNQEARQNNSFLKSVRNSTDFLQNVLIVLMLLACILAGYILVLAYKNDTFQNHIVDLNKKVMKDSVEKDKFFSIISHDLMNPFNALLGFSQMMTVSAKNGNQEDCVEYSLIVHESTKRILNLLQNLLVWSRMQNGKMKYTPKSVRIDELVSSTMMVVAPIARNKEIKLDWNVNSDITATVDPNMIGSVLQNLVTNAIKFTEKGGSVLVQADAESNVLNFSVTDTGVGMDETRLNKLFKIDKNSSSRGTDDEVGSGLGLIICKEFVEAHQGKIWVESTLGKGSNFCFSIPLI
ncbi:sensory transduction histidine kinase precursor [Aquipluma nitroreducens]|uniref:histidine kinase n=1 Tax=Aquipluma nitroreducens TaxID=2010828 RepID=A0A5K7SBX0_9BACT|nr:HAMP domain-containing sensor histidine kinase [Aquipluma nitroreducens]BBE18957.1 sensory transduction histidine kinase precursor [Aquipluma nitroreducens]